MEEVPKTIEHQIGGVLNDKLRFGLHGVKSDIVGSHPLESAQESARKAQETMKKKCIINTYGSAFPLKMDLDKQILSRFQRPPGAIPSSMLGLEAYTGNLDHIGFEDYLNDPLESESFLPPDMHHGMEVRLGLSKGPVYPKFRIMKASEYHYKERDGACSMFHYGFYLPMLRMSGYWKHKICIQSQRDFFFVVCDAFYTSKHLSIQCFGSTSGPLRVSSVKAEGVIRRYNIRIFI